MPEKAFSKSQTLLVAVIVSLVCSIVVSAAAVVLQPLQERNKRAAIRADILEVAGIESFEHIESRLVDLATGDYVDGDPEAFDAREAARDPERGLAIPAQLDIAGIDRRANREKVYLVRESGALTRVVLPIRGYGLWSTMYGFVGLTADGAEVTALKFYEHAETPGLGDQIDDEDWRASFNGKRVYDEAGDIAIEVIKGNVAPGDARAQYRVDGLSGATLTANGVSNTLRYWVGEHGYGPYLKRMRLENGS